MQPKTDQRLLWKNNAGKFGNCLHYWCDLVQQPAGQQSIHTTSRLNTRVFSQPDKTSPLGTISSTRYFCLLQWVLSVTSKVCTSYCVHELSYRNANIGQATRELRAASILSRLVLSQQLLAKSDLDRATPSHVWDRKKRNPVEIEVLKNSESCFFK